MAIKPITGVCLLMKPLQRPPPTTALGTGAYGEKETRANTTDTDVA